MKTWIAIGVVGVLAGVAGFALYANLVGDQSPTPQTAQQPTQEASSGIIATAEAAAPELASTLPDVKLKNRAGDMQSLRSWPGKSMIVNFWATWCAPCRKEIPLLKEISKSESAFQVVGIAIDFRDDVLKYADEIKLDYPLLIGEQDGLAAADAFGVASAGLPFTAFTDNKGRVVTILMGELTRAKADAILGNVKRVNKGELTPEAARGAIAAKLATLSSKA
jgi:thiol-disulfide isomerase/thioredoxin